jgi:hypothetical protein
MEFILLSSMSWCGGLLDSDVCSIIFPYSVNFFPKADDSSPTPESSSVATIHL